MCLSLTPNAGADADVTASSVDLIFGALGLPGEAAAVAVLARSGSAAAGAMGTCALGAMGLLGEVVVATAGAAIAM